MATSNTQESIDKVIGSFKNLADLSDSDVQQKLANVRRVGQRVLLHTPRPGEWLSYTVVGFGSSLQHPNALLFYHTPDMRKTSLTAVSTVGKCLVYQRQPMHVAADPLGGTPLTYHTTGLRPYLQYVETITAAHAAWVASQQLSDCVVCTYICCACRCDERICPVACWRPGRAAGPVGSKWQGAV